MRLLLAILVGYLGCLAISSEIGGIFGVGLPLGTPGTLDFIQYWSAWQLLRSGINPYNGELLHAVQASLGQPPTVTIMMWNPPWVPVLLAPLLQLPFHSAALIWFVCNLCLLFFIALITPRALGYSSVPLWIYCVGVCFLPLFSCIQLGQISLTYTAGLVLFLYSVRCERYLFAGVCISLLMSKPHLFFLFIIPGIFWLMGLSARHVRGFLLGMTLALGPLVAITIAYCPDAFKWWIAGIGNPTKGFGVVPVQEWKTATIATLIRTGLGLLNGKIPEWPLWVVPISGLVCTASYFAGSYLRPGKREIDWVRIAPALLCWCCLLGSYGWLFDQSILVIAHFSLLCRVSTTNDLRQRLITLIGLALTQGAMLSIAVGTEGAQHYYVWVPAAYLALLQFCKESEAQ